MSKKFRIGLDVDGVLADFNGAYQLELNRIGGTNYPYHVPTRWDYAEDAGFSREVIEEFWRTTAQRPTFWRNLPAFPAAIEDASALESRGLTDDLDLYYISKRPLHLRTITEGWLYHQDLIVSGAAVLHSNHKGHLARGLELDLMVDDKPGNLYAIKTHSPMTQCYLYDAPWNRNDYSSDFTRVTSIKEAVADYERIERFHNN